MAISANSARAGHFKRLRRFALYAAGCGSLLLLLVTLAHWSWLGRYRVGVSYATSRTMYAVMPVHDAFALRLSKVPWPLYRGFEVQTKNLGIPRDPLDGADPGFEQVGVDGKWLHQFGDFAVWGSTVYYASRSGGPDHRLTDVSVRLPYWLVALLSIPVPCWLLTRHRVTLRRERRRAAGECEVCGYDLRATPGRCPECGHVPPRRGFEPVARCDPPPGSPDTK